MTDDAGRVRRALEEARRALEAAEQAASAVAPAAVSALTVEGLNNRYQREFARHQRSRADKERIGKLLVKHLGKRAVMSLTTEDVEDYRDERREKPTRLGGPPKPATLNREIAQLRHMIHWAMRQKILPYDPLPFVKPLPEDNVRRTKIRTDEELQKILGQIDSDEIRVLILMLIDCGPRRMEAVSLRWSQVFFDRKRVELWKSKRTTKPRVFRLSERVMEGLRVLLKYRKKGATFVFPSPRDGRRHISPFWVLRKFKRAAEDAGIAPAPGESWRLHDLRSSFAYITRVIHKIPEKTVMRQMGHKTRSAFDRYGIGDDDELDSMYDVVDKNNEAAERELRGRRRLEYIRSQVRHVEKGADSAAWAMGEQGKKKT